MTAIGTGDWVECVGACGCHDAAWPDIALFIETGRVYLVTAVGVTADRPTEPALKVSEWPSLVFCIGHFRPIYRPKASILTALRAPIPSRSEPDVRERVR